MAAMMTKEDKQWILLAVLFCIGIIAAFYFIYYQQANERYRQKISTRDNLEADIDKYMAIVEGPDFHARIRDLAEKVAQFEQQLPDEREVPQLLKFLRNAADDADVLYESIISQAAIPGTFYVEVPFDIVLKGRYHNIGRVINLIENHPRLMKVDKINMEAGREAPFHHKLSFQLSTFIYNPTQIQDTTE